MSGTRRYVAMATNDCSNIVTLAMQLGSSNTRLASLEAEHATLKAEHATLKADVALLAARLDALAGAEAVVAEPPKVKGLKCPLCEFVTTTGAGLALHKRYKHDAEHEPKAAAKPAKPGAKLAKADEREEAAAAVCEL